MKFKFFTMMMLLVAFTFNGYATNPISPEAINFEKDAKIDKKMVKAVNLFSKFSQTKVGKWAVKKAIQANKFLTKAGVDLQDPVQKWLWYAIFGVIAGTVLYAAGFAFGPLWYLGYLIYLAGIICFWYWVYLKFLK